MQRSRLHCHLSASFLSSKLCLKTKTPLASFIYTEGKNTNTMTVFSNKIWYSLKVMVSQSTALPLNKLMLFKKEKIFQRRKYASWYQFWWLLQILLCYEIIYLKYSIIHTLGKSDKNRAFMLGHDLLTKENCIQFSSMWLVPLMLFFCYVIGSSKVRY